MDHHQVQAGPGDPHGCARCGRQETVNGMVKLTGQAANQMQKNKAVEVTRSTKGVRSVDPDGLVTAATAKTR
ncbi:MAG: BON domain-containing protein [Pseudoxanthomonas sp.]